MKVTSTPVLLPVADTVGALGRPTETALLGEDSAPGPLSFSVRALRGREAGEAVGACEAGCMLPASKAPHGSAHGWSRGRPAVLVLQNDLHAEVAILPSTRCHPTHTKETRRGLGRSDALRVTCTFCGLPLAPVPLITHSAGVPVQEAATLTQSPGVVVGSTVSMRSCS